MLKIIEIGKGTGSKVTVDRRLYLNAAKDALVEEGDVRACFLFCAAGKQVLRAELDRLNCRIVDAPPARRRRRPTPPEKVEVGEGETEKVEVGEGETEKVEVEVDEDEVGEGYGGWTAAEMKVLLRSRELPVSGNKAELAARLEEDDADEDEDEDDSILD